MYSCCRNSPLIYNLTIEQNNVSRGPTENKHKIVYFVEKRRATETAFSVLKTFAQQRESCEI